MIDIPALQELKRGIREQLERIEELQGRLGDDLSPRLRKLVELSTHSLHVVEGILFYLELEMRMAIAQDDALEHALQEDLGEDPLDIAETLERASDQFGVRAINLDVIELDREVVVIIPREVAVKHQLIAFGWLGQAGKSILLVAMADPNSIFARDDVQFTTNHEIKIYVASKAAIARAIDKYYPRPAPEHA